MAQIAFEKRDKLRAQLEAPVLKPLTADDRFGAVFEPATIPLPDDLLKQTANSLATGDVKTIHHEPITPEAVRRYSQELDGSTFRIQKALWDDRLATQQTRTAVRTLLVDEHIKSFVGQKQQEAERGDLSLGRFNVIRLHLEQFGKWIGVDATVSEIDGPILKKYQSHLLDMVKKRAQQRRSPRGDAKVPRFSATTAKEHLATVKTFVRWLWEMEVIAVLPRVLGNKSNTLKITAESTAPVIFDNAEVELLLKNATGRTKLFILLMLNCGMTQKDIADLRKSEVDFKAGRIIRKRSKTENFDSVPTVNYLLWPDTVSLLKQFQNHGDDPRALVNANGSALWAEQLDTEGKYGKTDNIRNAFSRLTSKLGLPKPLKSLKKTSSSKLRDHEKFNGFEDLFLGHAPQKLSDKHYTTAPQKLLDSAIRWLASEYGLASPG